MQSKVLILDDNYENVEIIKLIFEDEGFEVLGIYDHRLLPANIATFQPHLLIMDIHLVGADGRELANLLKTDPQTEQLPIILASTTHDPSKGFASPILADDYIAKPFDLMDLVNKAKALLAN